tara:strand:- start:21783 stop:24176 length:2394 start_codon:yes stop_codon:yes gene_type:complete
MAKVAEKLIIQIDVKDSEKAKKALKDIEVGFKRVGTKGKKDIGRLRLETEGLRRNLGQIRNNLLLVAFATEGLRRTFSGFAQARGQLEQFEARLRSMSGSAEIAQKQLKQFIDIAATTPFTVQEVVDGGVQLQAFGADAEALIPTMANLAAFMGRSVPEAANAFGRAFAGGRGAADVFRETGILAIIDDFESLDEALNKEKLSLTEFRIKMIEALSDPDGKIANGINELEGTLFQAFANMEDSVFMFRARVGEELQPFFLSLAKSVTNFFNAIDTDVIRDFGALLKVTFIGIASLAIQSLAVLAAGAIKASADMHLLTTAILGTSVSMETFNKAVKRNLFAILVTSIAAGVAIFNRLNNRIEETDDSLSDSTKTVEEFIEELKKAQEAENLAERNKLQAENIIKLQQQLDLLNATSAVDKEQIKQKRELSAAERKLIRDIEKRKAEIKAAQDLERKTKRFIEEIGQIERENANNRLAEGQALIELKGDQFNDFRNNEELMFKFSEEMNKKHIALAKLNSEETIALGKVNLLDEQFRNQARIEIEENFQKKREEIISESDRKINAMKDDDVLKQAEREALLLEQTRSFNLMVQDSYMQMFSQIQSAFANLVKSNMDQELKALRRTDKFRAASTEERQNMEDDIKEKFKAQQKLAFRAQQMLQIAQVFMSLNRAIFEIEAAAAPLLVAKVPGTAARVARLITGLKISSAIQAGLISAQKPPTFARGGSFVTDGPQQIIVGDNPGGRERVDVTPISSPNFDGPQGSEVTVNIMGNVIGTEEFVRDNLIPEIDRSIRRNLA